MKRIDIIGQNGNEGTHYEDPPPCTWQPSVEGYTKSKCGHHEIYRGKNRFTLFTDGKFVREFKKQIDAKKAV